MGCALGCGAVEWRGDGRADGALQLGDAGGHFRLEAVERERPLVVGQRLHVVARLVAEPAEGGERAGVVRVDRQRIDELRLGLLGLADFFQQPGQLDFRVGRFRGSRSTSGSAA